MNLYRLWETVTGRPHEKRCEDMVREATNRLIRAADNFSEKVIKPYSQSDDPVKMLFEDIERQRRASRRIDGRSKLHS